MQVLNFLRDKLSVLKNHSIKNVLREVAFHVMQIRLNNSYYIWDLGTVI